MIKSSPLPGVLLSAAVAFAIYAPRLDVSPPSLLTDESLLRDQARSIATTGRDRDGRILPLYFHLHDNVWAQPLPVYFTALFVSARDLPGSAIRLPSVVIAVLDVVLLYAVALRLLGRRTPALVGAGLLALAPSHFIHGRLALASVYPVAFSLAWLLGLVAFVQRRKPWLLFASTLCLGAGFYSHPSAVLMMPICFALTVLMVWSESRSGSRVLVAAAGFATPLFVLIPWFGVHHDVFRFTLGDWGLHTLANPRDGLRYSVLSWPALTSRSSVYWGFFSPSYLFFTGADDLVNSTRQAGVLLGVTAIPLVIGVVQVVKSRWADPLWRLILLAFVLAPLAASIFDEPKAAGRALGALPFGVLIAVAGVDHLSRHPARVMRLAVMGVLLLAPVQFYGFYADYFAAYPERWNAAVGAAAKE